LAKTKSQKTRTASKKDDAQLALELVERAQQSVSMPADLVRRIVEKAPQLPHESLQELAYLMLEWEKGALKAAQRELQHWEALFEKYKLYKTRQRRQAENQSHAKEEAAAEDLLSDL
jgi:hypothetical protein